MSDYHQKTYPIKTFSDAMKLRDIFAGGTVMIANAETGEFVNLIEWDLKEPKIGIVYMIASTMVNCFVDPEKATSGETESILGAAVEIK